MDSRRRFSFVFGEGLTSDFLRRKKPPGSLGSVSRVTVEGL